MTYSNEIKLVTWKQLSNGQEIHGYETSGQSSSFTAIIIDTNSAFVTCLMWGKTEEKITSEAMFKIKMTEDEFNAKYQDKAKDVLRKIQNKLIHDEIGYHEMWNSWLYGTPYGRWRASWTA